jgi:immunoglobulin-like protein involved in spore germination/sporulation and spore germination protein
MRFAAALSLLVGLLALAGCMSDGETKTVTVRETVTETGASGTVPNEAPALVTLYFLRDGKVAPEVRGIVSRPDIAAVTIHQLFEGTESDLTTAIPPQTRLQRLKIDGRVAAIELTPRLTDREALAQIAYTLTQFETVKRVSFNGQRPVGRAAFERQTPAILVESPLPDEEVEPGFEATGTANTFEATFHYELRDADGKILKKDFVTATSGSGTRGTFRFTVPYEVSRPQAGRLVVFEESAADGSRINEISIPLQLR